MRIEAHRLRDARAERAGRGVAAGACRFALAALPFVLFAPDGRADKSVSKQITPLPRVTGTCSIETKASGNSLTYECEFTNAGAAAVRFVFCAMADLNSKKIEEFMRDDREIKPVPGAKSYRLKQMGGAAGKLVCDLVNPKGGALSPASVYFGCKEIALQAGDKSKKFPIGSVAGYKLVTAKQGTRDQEVPFDKLKARDFSVVYTDQVNLTPTPKKQFDPDGTCPPAKGQGNFIDYDTTSIAEGVRSQWAFAKNSFIDPFIVYQPAFAGTVPLPCDADGDGFVDSADVQAIFGARNTAAVPGDPRDPDRDGRVTVNDARICTLRLTRQYVTYDEPPCVPTGFPARVAQLPACPVRGGAAPATTQEINLFNWYTETEPTYERFPAVLQVRTEGSLDGVRLQVTPQPGVPFDIPGGVHRYGSLTTCSGASTATCIAPAVEEGRRLEVTIDVTSLDHESPSFLQNGEFVQDTVPPSVVSHTAGFDASGRLVVVVGGEDATTTPLSAELWFSADGVAWGRTPMIATPDTLEEVRMRAFTASAGPFAAGQTVRYFVVMNDAVSNVVVYGIHVAARP